MGFIYLQLRSFVQIPMDAMELGVPVQMGTGPRTLLRLVLSLEYLGRHPRFLVVQRSLQDAQHQRHH